MSNRITKFTTAAIAALALSAGAFAQAPATAATNAAPAPTFGAGKIGVINIQAAIAATNEGRRDFDALQKKFEPKQTELKTLSDEVEGLKKQLAAQGDKLNDDEKNTRVRTIDSKSKDLQRRYEDAQNDFQQEEQQLASRIGNKMMEVLAKYATQNNLSMVIDFNQQQSPILWASEQVNITQAVVEAYNAQSGVPAPPPAAPGAQPRPAQPRPSTPAPKKPGM
jgi:outer membrane protein